MTHVGHNATIAVNGGPLPVKDVVIVERPPLDGGTVEDLIRFLRTLPPDSRTFRHQEYDHVRCCTYVRVGIQITDVEHHMHRGGG